jgi:hypothetical protein
LPIAPHAPHGYPVHRGRGRVLVAERGGAYSAASGPGASEPAPTATLDAAVRSLAAVPIDELDDTQVRAELSVIEEAKRRLEARSCRLAAALTDRERQRAVQARPDDPRAARNAERRTRDELQDQLRWTPSQAKQAQQLGSGLAHTPEAGSAFDAGQLPASHARLLADTLKWLDDDQAAQAEATLLAAARDQDARSFGRTCRRLLAELDHDAAMRAEDRRHARRRGNLVQTEDGMTKLDTQVAGLDGSTSPPPCTPSVAPTPPANNAPRSRPPPTPWSPWPAPPSTPAPPRQHGARPHLIIVAEQDIATGQRGGVVDTAFSGPLPERRRPRHRRRRRGLQAALRRPRHPRSSHRRGPQRPPGPLPRGPRP